MDKRILTILIAVIGVAGFGLYANVLMADPENAEAVANATSPMVTFSVVILIASLAVAVIASLLGVLKNPAALKKALLGVVSLGVVILISYLISDPAQVLDANGKVIAAAGSAVAKLTSTGIWASLFLLVIGGAFFVFDLLKGLVK
ncbi:hypothetical protein [Tenacibaculum amylolyticum]|uniref:hypothetical protein n=1 Tax=Tenacibaculum amylolyticum TaxID=104269 RepID=UPI0038930BAD